MRRALLTVVGLVVALSPAVVAHHAYEEFDRHRIVTIDGVITEYTYQNPHVVLTVKTGDASIHTVVWAAPNSLLRRHGFRSSTLQVGDRVVVSGSPHRDASIRTLSLITEVRRPADGQVWVDPRRAVTAAR
jgi:hypothetical protein